MKIRYNTRFELANRTRCMHSPLISGQDDNFSPTRLTCSDPVVLDEYMTSLIGYGVSLGIIFETRVEFGSGIYDILIRPIPSIKI